MSASDRAPPRIPAGIVSVADYQEAAASRIEPGHLAYIAGGSGSDAARRANREALAAVTLYSRVLTDCAEGTTRLDLLGQPLPHPIVLAPVAHQRLVHPDGERATARAAAASGALMIVSTLSSVTLEDLQSAAPGPKWFQLYWQGDRETTLGLVRRAEAAGYGAIVVTLDTPLQMPSRAAQRAGFRLPAEVTAASLVGQPARPQVALPAGASVIFQGMMSEAPRWDDLAWLVRSTDLPVLAKGVLHPDDASRLMASGVKGIVVSNHGGRALDAAPAALRALPAVRRAVGPSVPILVDGGIENGSDVLKALALGASAVAIGRPQLYALAVAGALGVAHMLKLLKDELEVAMALAGCPTLESISAEILFRPEL